MFLKCTNWKWDKVKREIILIPLLFRLRRFVVFIPWHFDTSLSLLNVKFAITGVTYVTRTEVIQIKTEYFILIAQLLCLLAGPLIVCSSACSRLPHFFLWGRIFLLILTLSVNWNLFLPLTLFPFYRSLRCTRHQKSICKESNLHCVREVTKTWASNGYFHWFGYRHIR